MVSSSLCRRGDILCGKIAPVGVACPSCSRSSTGQIRSDLIPARYTAHLSLEMFPSFPPYLLQSAVRGLLHRDPGGALRKSLEDPPIFCKDAVVKVRCAGVLQEEGLNCTPV